jgi:hypothetical protein
MNHPEWKQGWQRLAKRGNKYLNSAVPAGNLIRLVREAESRNASVS